MSAHPIHLPSYMFEQPGLAVLFLVFAHGMTFYSSRKKGTLQSWKILLGWSDLHRLHLHRHHLVSPPCLTLKPTRDRPRPWPADAPYPTPCSPVLVFQTLSQSQPVSAPVSSPGQPSLPPSSWVCIPPRASQELRSRPACLGHRGVSLSLYTRLRRHGLAPQHPL